MNELELQEQVVTPLVDQTNKMVIRTADQYMAADDLLGEVKKTLKKADKDYLEPLRKAKRGIQETWDNITKDLITPLKKAELFIKGEMLDFKLIQDKKKKEEEDRLQAKADEAARLERERLEKRAEKLKTPELKEQAADQAAAVVAPIVSVASIVPETKGTVYKKTWVGIVTDKQAALKAASDNPVLGALFDIDQGKLNKLAVAFKGELEFTGIEFKEVESIAKGTR